jgi:uncharacterized protein
MKNTLFTNIRFLLKEDGTLGDLPKPASRLAEFLGGIVEEVSFRRHDEPASTAIDCRRRPGHRRCAGKIVAGVDALRSFQIEWHCPVCGDQGIISGWQGTFWDKSKGRFHDSKNQLPGKPVKENPLVDLEDQLFALDENALTLPELHGFISAVIIGPKMVEPSKWLPRVFNDEGEIPEFSSMDEASRVMGSLLNYYNQIIRDMDEGRYQPYFNTKKAGKKDAPDPVLWCYGFVEGISLTENAWFAEEDETLAAFLLPILYFVDVEGLKRISHSTSDRKRKGFENEMMSMIPRAVLSIRKYWRGKTRETGSHSTPGVILPFDKEKSKTVGRNEPCPCGSGKKHKHCCGRDQ